MNLGFLFFQAFAISFLGSVPPGAISLSIVQKALDGKERTAIFWAIIATLLEAPHFFIAWFIHFQWLNSSDLLVFTRPLSILLLIALGWNSWRSSDKGMKKKALTLPTFLGINLLNLAAIPFWVGTLQWTMPLENHLFVFWLAASAGAFVCLFLYAKLGFWISRFSLFHPLLLQKSVALSFFGLALWQLFHLLPIF